ncbi:hypothetical protein ACPZ19_46555 [Amycolatopsis lurida]|uniref:hypothetical protein n=1 Tax=Amycolatopsis sp. YIM 10 TaxID=2653857 RepID=UPI0012907AA7|nr:hypothetical protein [Amycolatopsis sp. YIM 10]QFU86549.1 hypothetical protein YIM_06675 [Amycolatopsis sp. YIM 10]
MKIFFLNDNPGTTVSCAAAGRDARARRGTGMPSVAQHRSIAAAPEQVFRGRSAAEFTAEAGIGNVLPKPLPTYVLPTTADAQGVKPIQMHVPPPLIERGP